MNEAQPIIPLLTARFGGIAVIEQHTADGTPTVWIRQQDIPDVMKYLKNEVALPYKMLYDLTAIDERKKTHTNGAPTADFTVVYHLTSLDRNEDIRIKTAADGEAPTVLSITGIWPSANWY